VVDLLADAVPTTALAVACKQICPVCTGPSRCIRTVLDHLTQALLSVQLYSSFSRHYDLTHCCCCCCYFFPAGRCRRCCLRLARRCQAGWQTLPRATHPTAPRAAAAVAALVAAISARTLAGTATVSGCFSAVNYAACQDMQCSCAVSSSTATAAAATR
jgi:hypothetical protein